MKYEIIKIEKRHWWSLANFPLYVTVKMEDGTILKTTTEELPSKNFIPFIEVDIQKYYRNKRKSLPKNSGLVFEVEVEGEDK